MTTNRVAQRRRQTWGELHEQPAKPIEQKAEQRPAGEGK